jgi:hypothetical protein
MFKALKNFASWFGRRIHWRRTSGLLPSTQSKSGLNSCCTRQEWPIVAPEFRGIKNLASLGSYFQVQMLEKHTKSHDTSSSNTGKFMFKAPSEGIFMFKVLKIKGSMPMD